jgi:tetratricopeptide (TPR) repeat protein
LEETDVDGDLYDVIDDIDEHLAELEFEEAEALLEEARAEFGDEPELVVLGAEIAYERADWEQCIDRVDAGVERVSDPYRAELCGFKGYALFYLNREDEAREAFNEAIALDGELWMALVGRAITNEHEGYPEAALLDLDRAIQLDDQEAEPFAARGSVYLQLDELDAAQRDLAFAVEIDPYDEDSRLNLARLQANNGETSEAIETLEPLVEEGEDPDYVLPGALLRSQMSLTLGSTEAALEDAQTAIDAAPDQPWGYLQRAAAYLNATNAGEAIAALKEADERIDDPRDVPDLYSLRASAYQQLGKQQKAEENQAKVEGVARLPEIVYGPELNPAGDIPANPDQPVDVRTILREIFGDPDAAPEGYDDKVRGMLRRVSEVAEENPDAGEIEVELPPIEDGGESPGQLVFQLQQFE